MGVWKLGQYLQGSVPPILMVPRFVKTRGQTRIPDSSQRDVPVYVVFLQGVLTVPVGCRCQWAVRPSETFPQGVL